MVCGQLSGVPVGAVHRIPERDHDARHGEPLLIRLLEESRRDAPLGVQDERARIRDAVEARARLLLAVEQVILLDDDGPFVRQNRERDATRL